MKTGSYPEFFERPRETGYPEFSPSAGSRRGRLTAKVSVFLGCLRGMGHYQDFSMADILERVEFKRVGGRESAVSSAGNSSFPTTPPRLELNLTRRTADWQPSRPISRGRELRSANQGEPDTEQARDACAPQKRGGAWRNTECRQGQTDSIAGLFGVWRAKSSVYF